eukprot:2600183-Ditylum_brightwellii.AAC.1
MERGNVKTSPNHVTRDVTVQENITKASTRKSSATIMVFLTMTRTNVTLYKPAGSMFNPHTALQNSRGSGRSGLSRMSK